MADKVRNENFVCIQGWMINDLNLKGNELLIYAIIYGFSQAENQVFNGGLQYLADWTNSTKQGVLKNLKSLIDKGYIGKNEKIINNVKFCEYYTTKFNGALNKVEQGIKQSLTGGIKQSSPNNININNINNNISNKKVRKKERLSFDDLINNYSSNEDLRAELKNYLKVIKGNKGTLTNRAIELLLEDLDKLTKDVPVNMPDMQDKKKIEIVQQSIKKGWNGFFELKKDKEQKQEESSKEGSSNPFYDALYDN